MQAKPDSISSVNGKIQETITALELKVDSLNSVVNQLITQQKNQESIDVITKIDGLYDNAFDNILVILISAAGILGILVPYALQRLQNKYYEKRLEALHSEFNDGVDEKFSKISKSIDKSAKRIEKRAKKQIDELKEKNTKSYNHNLGLSQILAAKNNYENELYVGSYIIYQHALRSFIISGHRENLKHCISMLKTNLSRIDDKMNLLSAIRDHFKMTPIEYLEKEIFGLKFFNNELRSDFDSLIEELKDFDDYKMNSSAEV